MAEPIFLQSHNETSGRFAVLDDNGTVAFVYLTQPRTNGIERDVVAYTRAEPVETIDWEAAKKAGWPPPLSAQVASEDAVQHPRKEQLSFQWSADGEAVALLFNNKPIAFAAIGLELGHSKAIGKECGLANPWDQAVYDKLFAG
jgi:hypothetical protein